MDRETLARLMNVSYSAVAKWETDERMPDADDIVKLAEMLGVTTDYLLVGERLLPPDISEEDLYLAKKLREIPEVKDDVASFIEAVLLAQRMQQLPEDDRELIKQFMKLIFAKYEKK